MKGSISKINQGHQRGEISGEDGKTYGFKRENMVLWLQFQDLQPGTAVTFDLEAPQHASTSSCERNKGGASISTNTYRR